MHQNTQKLQGQELEQMHSNHMGTEKNKTLSMSITLVEQHELEKLFDMTWYPVNIV